MPTVKVVDMAGKETGSVELLDSVFGLKEEEISTAAVHSVIRAYLLNQRQGTQSTKTRAEVSGGGKKPWRQKGTGRARQGSTRSPQWTHGGIALGPKPRLYKVTINKKVKDLAMRSILSDKMANSQLVFVNKVTVEGYSTKTVANMLKALDAERKTLIIFENADAKNVIASCANIPAVKTTFAGSVNAYDLLNADKVIFEKTAAEKLQEVYA